MLFKRIISTTFIITLAILFSANIKAQAQQEDKYQEELNKLQKEIEYLKLKILETRKSLKIFEDMILFGTLTGTKLTIFYQNNLKKAEVLEIAVSVDGFLVSEIKDKDKIKESTKKEIVIYDETEVIPDKHVIDVVFTIQGEEATKGEGRKKFKKAVRYEVNVEKEIATYVKLKTVQAPGRKTEALPDDIDIIVTSEKVKLLSK